MDEDLELEVDTVEINPGECEEGIAVDETSDYDGGRNSAY